MATLLSRLGCHPPVCQGRFGRTAAVGAMVLSAALLASAAAGDLDPSFGTNGKAVVPLTFATAARLQADGKILVAGLAGWRFGLARLMPNGEVDPSFGPTGDGVATADFHAAFTWCDALAVYPDGRAVTAGYVYTEVGHLIAMARHNTDGTLDMAFGTGGLVVAGVPGGVSPIAVDVAVASEGILVLATVGRYPYGREIVLLRFDDAGALDTSFGSQGVVTTSLEYHVKPALAVQPDGKILIAGARGFDVALLRYASDGTVDETFGNAGMAVTALSSNPTLREFADQPAAVAVQRDGKILVVGTALGREVVLVRFNQDGTLDESFGQGGRQTNGFGTDVREVAVSVAVHPTSGKIVVGGNAVVGFDMNEFEYSWDFGLARYNADGTPDLFFGNGGATTTDFGAHGDRLEAMVIQNDGRIVAAGGAGPVRVAARYKHVSTPAEQITTLANIVIALNLQHGVENSLDAKLQNAYDALEAATSGDARSACAKLGAFVNEVNAQSGKALTPEQAGQLSGAAAEILTALGCS